MTRQLLRQRKHVPREYEAHVSKVGKTAWGKHDNFDHPVKVGRHNYRVVTSGSKGQKITIFDAQTGKKVRDPAEHSKVLDRFIH